MSQCSRVINALSTVSLPNRVEVLHSDFCLCGVCMNNDSVLHGCISVIMYKPFSLHVHV